MAKAPSGRETIRREVAEEVAPAPATAAPPDAAAAVATMPPATPSPSVSVVVADAIAISTKLDIAVEQLYWQLGIDGWKMSFASEAQLQTSLTREQYSLLRVAGRTDPRQTERAVQRCRNVQKHQAAIGTWADYQQTIVDRDAAVAKHDAEAPAIKQQIVDLQQQLAALEGDMAAKRREVDRRETALAALRSPDSLPEHVKREYEHTRRQIREKHNPAISQLESEINVLSGALKLSDHPRNDTELQAVREYCRGIKRPDLYSDAGFQQLAWQTHRRECQEKVAALKNRLAELLAAREAAVSEADVLLDHYVPKS
jgi:hypothetical protein